MNLREMMDGYSDEGLTRELAASRVCQDIILKAISEGPLNRNVTIKGGVVMRSITKNNRRSTRDVDLDFIHYSLDDESIRTFVQKLIDVVSKDRLNEIIRLLIFEDTEMYEDSMDDIVKRVSSTFKDEQYLRRVSGSRQRWVDDDIHEIAGGIISYLEKL